VFGGGAAVGVIQNIIDYITIATVGNATDFGDLSITRTNLAGCGSDTRGAFGGGETAVTYSNVIDYVTIASVGNATDFGDLTEARKGLGACSNVAGSITPTPTSAAMGVFVGGGSAGSNYQSSVQYINIATTGDALYFGDLSVRISGAAGFGSSTRGVWAGGDPGNAPYTTNVIDYVTIATTGNAIDFGDLTVARDQPAGCSNSGGGL
jgi:hypothetical protein